MNGFPNMAGKPDIDDALAAELEAAGIHAGRYPFLKDGKHEIDTSVRGDLHGWRFERAWYYWRCSGPGIEVAAAERLHAEHGKDVRVAGHCGCPSPTSWYDGLAVGDYHVDTPVGLKALADTIKSLVERAKQPAPSDTPPARQAVEAVSVDEVAWQALDNAPRDGTPINVRAVSTYRYQPYKPSSPQRKKGIRGRWQVANEYGSWDNCQEPRGEWSNILAKFKVVK